MGSYDSGTYQPIFSVVGKECKPGTEKKRFVRIIRDAFKRAGGRRASIRKALASGDQQF